eukprot:712893-Rhodomonas_salina.1
MPALVPPALLEERLPSEQAAGGLQASRMLLQTALAELIEGSAQYTVPAMPGSVLDRALVVMISVLGEMVEVWNDDTGGGDYMR